MVQNLSRTVFVIVLLLFAFFLTLQVPLDRDEGINLRQTACARNLHSQTFIDNCNGAYNLTLFGHDLPLRAFYYNGFSQNFFFAPFFALWPNYLMLRIFGLLFLFLLGLLIARWSGVDRSLGIALTLSSFPLLLNFLMEPDHAIQGFFVLGLPFGLARVEKIWQGLFWGVLCFLTVEMKLLVVIFAPAMFLLYYWECRRLGKALFSAPRITALVIPIILLLLLLSARNRGGEMYVQELLFIRGGSLAWNIVEHFTEKTLPFFVSLPYFWSRIYVVENGPHALTIIFWAIYGTILYIGRKNSFVWRAFAVFLCAGLGLEFVAIAESGHHYMMLFPFLLLACAFALRAALETKKWTALALLALFVGLQVFMSLTTIKRPTVIDNHSSRMPVYHELQRLARGEAGKFLFVQGDIGLYFALILNLPKEQAITWPRLKEKEDFLYLKEKVKKLGLKPVFFFREGGGLNQELLLQEFPHLKKREVPRAAADSIWEIWY